MPSLAFVWSLFNENIPLERLVETGRILCWSAKWLGEERVFYASLQENGRENMLKRIYDLLSEADVVVTYNGDSHDLPFLNAEFVSLGFKPPAPYKTIDIYKTIKKRFKFPSRKLQYVAKALGVGEKEDNGGFEVWIGCMNGDEESWRVMKKYNIQDTNLLEAVYKKILPWITNHPNANLYNSDNENNSTSCPVCSSENLIKRGFIYTATLKYQRYRCNDCGSWSRGKKSISSSEIV